jgi:hypothetical protein
MHNIACYTIRNNQSVDMEVSNLVIGYSRVQKFFEEYYRLPEEERLFTKYDIFSFESIEEALECHIDSVVSEISNTGKSF